MALIKKEKVEEKEFVQFENSSEAEKTFADRTKSEDERLAALDYFINNESVVFILDQLLKITDNNDLSSHIYIDHVFTYFEHKPKSENEFDRMTKMLQSQNVYLRNMVIKYLQEYGSDAKKFVKKLMDDNDKDIRIFAINILGDVNYEESVDMLRYFIAMESDINAMMTAVDYLGEIGSEKDIELLESVKKEHDANPYVVFGVDTAIERIRG